MLPLPDPDNVLGYFRFELMCGRARKDWYFMDLSENCYKWKFPEVSFIGITLADLESVLEDTADLHNYWQDVQVWAEDNMPQLLLSYVFDFRGTFPSALTVL